MQSEKLTWAKKLLVLLGIFFSSSFTFNETAAFAGGLGDQVRGSGKPNIVWIMSEDNSKHYLKLFDETGAATPNIAAMAENGIVFDRAFSNAPVCSVARTTLITGCYAPRLGTHYHRRIKSAELNESYELFPALLRKAGYYTTNNAKEDYNCEKSKDVWDASGRNAHWRNRTNAESSDSKRPFFHVQTFADSHEGSLHFKSAWLENPDLKTKPENITLAEYHPDNSVFRMTYARYHDRIGIIDNKVGQVIEELREAGELENTFVFYFGDHGGVLPRGKGYIYESGLHVPLVVRVPEKWKSLSAFEKGTRTGGFVEFVDFGPTVLNLAGVDVPKTMDGLPFLGTSVSKPDVDSRNSTIGYSDRMDEKYDMCRSLRVGDWKYIRNFQAIYPDGLQNNYRYDMLAYESWREAFKKGSLNSVQSAFFLPKPVEQLFDLSKDPHEVNNLAADPAHQKQLDSMRTELSQRLIAMRDLGFFPESQLVDEVDVPFVDFGESKVGAIERYLKICDLALTLLSEDSDNENSGHAAAMKSLAEATRSEDPNARYWAYSVCSILGGRAKEFGPDAVKSAKADPSLVVRIRAAEFVGLIEEANPVPLLNQIMEESQSSTVNLMALQSLVLFRDGPAKMEVTIDREKIPVVDAQCLRRIGYLLGLSSAETNELAKGKPKQGSKKNKK